MPSSPAQPNPRPRVVVVGGGFGGLAAARALAGAPAEVLVVDRHNHHLFQPLLYQVATAALSPGNIASPIRKVLRAQRNAEVVMAEVTDVDLAAGTVEMVDRRYAFDYLVLAAGARTNYFGNGGWARHAPGLKTLDEAVDLRARFLLAFEQAEMETDEAARRAALTFAIVGAGPTGVEMAGALAELSRKTLRGDFRNVRTDSARVLLLDGQERVLTAFPAELSDRARRDLESLGVELLLGTSVTAVDERGLVVERDGREERIDASNVVWAAGVRGEPIGERLGVAVDRAGRVPVGPDLSVDGHPNVFVVGDLARAETPGSGEPVPGVAQGALQMGRFVGEAIAAELEALARGAPAPARGAFRYRDKGSLATIGRDRAVADVRGLRFGGFLAFAAWGLVHLLFLIDYRNRLLTMAQWIWTYFFHDRGVRLITGEGRAPRPVRPPPDPRAPRG